VPPLLVIGPLPMFKVLRAYEQVRGGRAGAGAVLSTGRNRGAPVILNWCSTRLTPCVPVCSGFAYARPQPTSHSTRPLYPPSSTDNHPQTHSLIPPPHPHPPGAAAVLHLCPLQQPV
jgi:hypothetical protein